MSKAELILKKLEKLAEDKTIQEIHEMIQGLIEEIERENPSADLKGIPEFLYLIERRLVERREKKALN